MDASSTPLLEILLTTGRILALQLNDRLAVRVVHNAPLLVEWRGHGEAMPASLQLLLEELLPLPRARAVMEQLAAVIDTADEGGVPLGTAVLRTPHGGGPDRHAALSLHRVPTEEGLPLLLLLRDVTPLEGLQLQLGRTRESLAATLAALRASPRAIRLFLAAAMASVGALRATMKTPGREQDAAQAKLSRLKEDVDRLGAEARAAGLDTIAAACGNFAQQVVSLRGKTQLSGDELLSLAPLLDQVASSVGDAIRIEEQRHVPQPKAPAAGPPAAAPVDERKEAQDWARGAERAWSSFVRHRGEELGTLVKLQVQGAQLVPHALRRDVDDMLQHLLRNAVEHGIETPEQRLAADKPVVGAVSVKFADKGQHGLIMTVHDDGRGFDVERIGRAALHSGLVSGESLLEYDPGEVVGLIFKPAFSTENLQGEAGRGRGMSFLRRAVTRLGGQITVATKPGRYTQFVIQLPTHAQPEVA
jgi:signal transduction histidine kinase